jgi:hypothetical protein
VAANGRANGVQVAFMGIAPTFGKSQGVRPYLRDVARRLAGMTSSRPYPYVGMPVRVVYLGAVEEAVIAEVHDDGRTLVVSEDRFTLRRVNGRFVRQDEPPYGTRLAFGTE